MPLAGLALMSMLVCDFALGPLSLLLNLSQTVPCLLSCHPSPHKPLSRPRRCFSSIRLGESPVSRQCCENEEVTCLPQGHLAKPQLDSCSDDLLSDAILRSGRGVAVGRWRLFWMLSVEGKRLAALGLVAVRSPVQISPPADYRLWLGP